MRLAAVYFDDTVCIPGGKDVGGGMARQDLRDSCFHANDGWSINEIRDGVFVLHREGMAEAATVGGYGYTYTMAPPEPENITPVVHLSREEMQAMYTGPEQKPKRRRK